MWNIPHIIHYTMKDEVRKMKKRIATLLTLALSTTLLLGGCGGSSDTETTNNDSGNSSGGFLSGVTSSKSETLSGVLSTEKVIGYEVDSVDKAETPENIYFFDNGKVTIIPGKEFELTMGDFAQMTDEEIWEEYELKRETYAETYLTDMKINAQYNYLLREFYKQEQRTYKNYEWYDEIQFLPAVLEAVRGKTYSQAENIYIGEITGSDDYSNGLGQVARTALDSYKNFQYLNENVEDIFSWGTYTPLGNYSEEDEDFWDTSEFLEDNIGTFSGTFFEDAITNYKNTLATIENMKEDIKYYGPFFDMPFYFVIETDSTGNNVANEKLVYPTLEDEIGVIPTNYYQYLKFANVDGIERQIYDTTYNCFGLGSGESIFCTRNYMTLDTVDSPNILIDLNKDELNELFKEEITARYE